MQNYTVSEEETVTVIKDFLELGHVENIAAMFQREPENLSLTGAVLNDERFKVRLGVSVLFEYLLERQCEALERAIPSLVSLLDAEHAHIRGEALSILALIGTDQAMQHIRALQDDPDPAIRDLVADILEP